MKYWNTLQYDYVETFLTQQIRNDERKTNHNRKVQTAN